jgi:hypothetical protein
MLTMLLGGLWHGAAGTFLLWGALHGLALVANHHWNTFRGPNHDTESLPARCSGWLITMLVVLIGWVLFRAANATNAVEVLVGTLRATGVQTLTLDSLGYLVLAFAMHLTFARQAAPLRSLEARIARVSWPRFAFAYGMAVGIGLLFVNTGYRAFIYFQVSDRLMQLTAWYFGGDRPSGGPQHTDRIP